MRAMTIAACLTSTRQVRRDSLIPKLLRRLSPGRTKAGRGVRRRHHVIDNLASGVMFRDPRHHPERHAADNPAAAELHPDSDAFGSAEHVRATFARAAAATDRALGLWLARHESRVHFGDRRDPQLVRTGGELPALRAMLRASVTTYVRQLREQGMTPERMLVLVKAAAAGTVARGVDARELVNDLVRWSIEAFFDE